MKPFADISNNVIVYAIVYLAISLQVHVNVLALNTKGNAIPSKQKILKKKNSNSDKLTCLVFNNL